MRSPEYQLPKKESRTAAEEILAKVREICSAENFGRFSELLPGYLEYAKEKNIGIELPIIHGTGSYALKRILREGFVPQEGGRG